MITVQPIRYTSHPQEWHRLAQALGLIPAFPPQPGWSEFDGDGILAIHQANAGEALDGHTDLHLLTDEVDALAARLIDLGLAVSRRVLDDIGTLLTVTVGSGAAITISGGARRTESGPLAVQPIWYQADLAEPRAILEAIGLVPRVASDAGTWVDFTADGGGRAAVHHGDDVRFELSLEYSGDLDALARQLSEAAFEAVVADEAYNRTLRVRTPDGDELWINGEMGDLYGYTRMA